MCRRAAVIVVVIFVIDAFAMAVFFLTIAIGGDSGAQGSTDGTAGNGAVAAAEFGADGGTDSATQRAADDGIGVHRAGGGATQYQAQTDDSDG
jgi:hypothetical protein